MAHRSSFHTRRSTTANNKAEQALALFLRGRREACDFKVIKYAAPDSLCIADSFELVAVLQTRHAVRAANAADGYDEFVVWHVDALHVSVSVRGLDLKQPLGHNDIDGTARQELAMHTSDDLPQRFDETANRDRSDSGGWIVTMSALKRMMTMVEDIQGRRGVNVLNVSGAITVTW